MDCLDLCVHLNHFHPDGLMKSTNQADLKYGNLGFMII